MPSISEMAPQEQTRPLTVRCKQPGSGLLFSVAVEYYPHRITGEPVAIGDDVDDEDAASIRNAQGFIDMVADWDITGEVRDQKGAVVVPAGAKVPLEPEAVRLVPLWITNQITTAVIDDVFPNRNGSRGSRRR